MHSNGSNYDTTHSFRSAWTLDLTSKLFPQSPFHPTEKLNYLILMKQMSNRHFTLNCFLSLQNSLKSNNCRQFFYISARIKKVWLAWTFLQFSSWTVQYKEIPKLMQMTGCLQGIIALFHTPLTPCQHSLTHVGPKNIKSKRRITTVLSNSHVQAYIQQN